MRAGPAVLLVAALGCALCAGCDSSTPAPRTSAPSTATTSSASSASPSATSSPAPSTGAQGAASASATPASAVPSASSAATADSARCRTGELTGRLVPDDGGAGAGQRSVSLVLTNSGSRTCTVDGFGGVALVGASGSALPTRQVRLQSSYTGSAILTPGGSAVGGLQWSVVPGTGDATSGDCQPTAATLRVIPPDETQPLSIPWTGGPVCEGGTLRQVAYHHG